MLRLACIFVLVAVAAAHARADDVGRFEVQTELGKTLTLRVHECGRILGAKGVEYVRDYDREGRKIFSHSGGRQRVVREVKLPLEAGTYFGCTVYVPVVAPGDRLVIDHAAVVPATARSIQPQGFVYAHEYTAKKVANPRYWWHSFEKTPPKAFEGEWQFQIRHQGKVLVSQAFHISRPGP